MLLLQLVLLHLAILHLPTTTQALHDPLQHLFKAGHKVDEHLVGQCSNAPVETGICPTSFGGFHYLCPGFNFTGARTACQRFGWELAEVDDLTSGQAAQTQKWCTTGSPYAWIASYNGLSADPCMFQAFGGMASGSSDYTCMSNVEQSIPVLCKEVSRLLSTLTSTITRTLYTGVEHATVTVTATDCKRRGRVDPPRVLLQDALQQDPPNPGRPCSNACSVPQARHLRIVQEAVPYGEADAVCRKHGWRLADLTQGMSGQVRALLQTCAATFMAPAVWVRSYEGVDGAACVLGVYGGGQVGPVLGSGVSGTFGYTPNDCDNFIGPLYPLCQLNCKPVPTGHGPHTGTATSFTSVVRTTSTVVAPLNVVTVTVTQWPRHNPRNRSCCCRQCQNL